jgi:hypothetical protein
MRPSRCASCRREPKCEATWGGFLMGFGGFWGDFWGFWGDFWCFWGVFGVFEVFFLGFWGEFDRKWAKFNGPQKHQFLHFLYIKTFKTPIFTLFISKIVQKSQISPPKHPHYMQKRPKTPFLPL